MTVRQRTIYKGIQMVVLCSLAAVLFLIIAGVIPFQQISMASRTVLSVATNNSNDMLGLGVICVGAGLFVLSDRRRRARGRQASS